ncbi:Trk system potassium transporter TrkA, partial [Thioclava sp. BHET1]
ATFDTESFFDGRAQLLGIALEEDCPVLNTPLRQLTDLSSTLRAIVVGVRRDGRLFAPEPGDQLFAGDQIYVFTHSEDVNRTLEIFGKSPQKQERVVIVGGGNVGLAVARELENRADRIRAKIIERDRGRAERAADALERTIVLNGDGMDIELLLEANIDRADAVLVLTDDDKTNLLVAVRAKQAGCPMAIALVNDPTLVPLMAALDIDAYINPRATTVSSILRHIRHGRVRAIYSIGDAEAEVIEAQVLSTSPIAGQMIRDIAFPEGVLVGGVLKGDKLMKPAGALRIEEGDVIALFAMTSDVPEVERLMQVSIDFF